MTDVDGDARPDLAFLRHDLSSGLHFVRVHFAAGEPLDFYPGAFGPFRFEDADRDGLADLLSYSGGGLKVFRAAAPARFPSFGRLESRNGFHLVAAGDVNGDGVTDLVQDGFFFVPSLFVYLGRAEGGFGPPSSFAAAHSEVSLWIADVTGDGVADVVTRSTSEAAVFAGRGDGTFEEPRLSATPLLSGLAFGAAVYGGRGDGTFERPRYYTTGNDTDLPTLVPADLDGDGRPDLVVRGRGALHFLFRK